MPNCPKWATIGTKVSFRNYTNSSITIGETYDEKTRGTSYERRFYLVSCKDVLGLDLNP